MLFFFIHFPVCIHNSKFSYYFLKHLLILMYSWMCIFTRRVFVGVSLVETYFNELLFKLVPRKRSKIMLYYHYPSIQVHMLFIINFKHAPSSYQYQYRKIEFMQCTILEYILEVAKSLIITWPANTVYSLYFTFNSHHHNHLFIQPHKTPSFPLPR